jgi:hypothetical protein
MLPRFFHWMGVKRACYKTTETFVANYPSHGAVAGRVPGKT